MRWFLLILAALIGFAVADPAFAQDTPPTNSTGFDDAVVIVTVLAGFAAGVIQLIVRQFALSQASQHLVQVAIAVVLAAFAGLAVVATMDGLTFESFEDILAAAAIAFGASQGLYAVILKLVQGAPPPTS